MPTYLRAYFIPAVLLATLAAALFTPGPWALGALAVGAALYATERLAERPSSLAAEVRALDSKVTRLGNRIGGPRD